MVSRNRVPGGRGKRAPDSDGLYCTRCDEKVPPRKIRSHRSDCTPSSPGSGTHAAGGGREFSSSVQASLSIRRDRDGIPVEVSEFARDARGHVVGRWVRER
jgi:hypothetical protein